MSKERAVFIDGAQEAESRRVVIITAPELESYGVYVWGGVCDWRERVGQLVVLRKTNRNAYGGYKYWEEVTNE